jgi:uncharacterized membrane protein YfcA
MFHWIYLIYPLIGICAGFLAGVLGLGGGIIIVPALLIVFPLESISPNIQVHLAVGTSMAVVIVNLAISLRSHFKHPEVYTLIPYVK